MLINGADFSHRLKQDPLRKWLSVLPLDFLDAYESSRLIAFEKNPGVRLIGIGDGLSVYRSKCQQKDLELLGDNLQFVKG